MRHDSETHLWPPFNFSRRRERQNVAPRVRVQLADLDRGIWLGSWIDKHASNDCDTRAIYVTLCDDAFCRVNSSAIFAAEASGFRRHGRGSLAFTILLRESIAARRHICLEPERPDSEHVQSQRSRRRYHRPPQFRPSGLKSDVTVSSWHVSHNQIRLAEPMTPGGSPDERLSRKCSAYL